MPGTIPILVIQHGEGTVEVPADEYAAAAAAGELPDFIDEITEDVDLSTVAVDPDGRLFELELRGTTRRSLRGVNVTDAVALVVASTRPHPDCGNCQSGSRRPCSRHIAERIIEAAHQEDLVILPAVEADAMIARFVAAKAGKDQGSRPSPTV